MTTILGIIQFAIILIICIFELNKKSPAVFLWAILLIMFGIMHLMSILLGSNDGYTTQTMNQASVFVILFCIVYLIVRYILSKNSKVIETDKSQLNDDKNNVINRLMYISFYGLIVIVILRIILLSKQAGGIAYTSWETMRETTGGYFSFSQIFSPIYFAFSSCIILALQLKNKKILLLSSIIIIIEVTISRNRIEILPFIVAITYYYIIKKNNITWKKIITLALIAIVSIYVIYALRVFRHSGSIKEFFNTYNLSSFHKAVMDKFKNDDGELSLRKNMYFFIENNNEFENFGKGHTYTRMLLVLVPTSWSFGLKPPDFAITMGKAVLPNVIGYSVHPTLFGDVYANFGMLGFLMGSFWAVFVTIIDFIIVKRKKMIKLPLAYIFAITYVMQARGSVYNAFSWAIYSSIILAILYFVTIILHNTFKNKKKQIYLIETEGR